MQTITEIEMMCFCGWKGAVANCEISESEGSLHCPNCNRLVEQRYIKNDYKCSSCGLEIVVAKQPMLLLPKAECQDCGTMTMEPSCNGTRHRIKI